jgi:tetratricopeptide (TPR) repeat protein
VEGDPLRLLLPARTSIDTEVLSNGSWVEAVSLPGLGRDLLEGLAFPANPVFEFWLESERRHLAVASESVLREAALSSLAAGEPATASDYASRLVGINPYDENHHVLLITSLSNLGDRDGAARHLENATALFRRELGVNPSPALRHAATAPPISESRRDARPTVLAQLDAGQAAIAAGALETGLATLRQAAGAARRLGDRALLARSLVALGSTLVHAARGTDEEGAAALYEARSLSENLRDTSLAAKAARELAWVEFLRARYERAFELLDQASRLAVGDESELAWIDLIRGGCHTDAGDYGTALPHLRSAIERVERVERAGAAQPGAIASAHLGRWHLLRGELEPAREALRRSLQIAREGWTAFVAWPESLIADADLRVGDVDAAAAGFEHAYALGCQIGDPCWESIAARGLGLVAAARGEISTALEWLESAPRRCRRLPDAWLWVEGYCLEALCRVAVEHRAPSAPRWIDELETLTARAGMRELLARARMHRATLGEAGALESARTLATEIDNPALTAELADYVAL